MGVTTTTYPATSLLLRDELLSPKDGATEEELRVHAELAKAAQAWARGNLSYVGAMVVEDRIKAGASFEEALPPKSSVSVTMPISIASQLFALLGEALGHGPERETEPIVEPTLTREVPNVAHLKLADRFNVLRWHEGTTAHEVVQLCEGLGIPVHGRPVKGYPETRAARGIAPTDTLHDVWLEFGPEGLTEILQTLIADGYGFPRRKSDTTPVITGKLIRHEAKGLRMRAESFPRRG